MVGLFGTETHLSAPLLVVETSTSEVLLDVEVVVSMGTVALVDVVLTLGSGVRVSTGGVPLVLLSLLVGTRARGHYLLTLVGGAVLRLFTVGVEQ